MKLPTEQQCLDYFTEYKVPKNIFNHCKKVREVASFLAQQLTKRGISLHVELVDRTALLHDLFKMVTIKELKPNKFHNYAFSEDEIIMWKKLREQYPHKYEGEVAFILFKDTYPDLALALRNVSNPRHENPGWEEVVVHYADWRIFQEKIVSLQERLLYLQEMYPRDDTAWKRYEQKMKNQEDMIFSHLDFSPEELKEAIENGNEAIKEVMKQ